MNNILSKKQRKFQDIQTDVHNARTCGMCELTRCIRDAELKATLTTQNKQKLNHIPTEIMQYQKGRLDATKIKRIVSSIHKKRYKQESYLYHKMCKENYIRKQKEFEHRLESDRSAIYRPLKDQVKGNIEALRDEDDLLHTEPIEVAGLHA